MIIGANVVRARANVVATKLGILLSSFSFSFHARIDTVATILFRCSSHRHIRVFYGPKVYQPDWMILGP